MSPISELLRPLPLIPKIEASYNSVQTLSLYEIGFLEYINELQFVSHEGFYRQQSYFSQLENWPRYIEKISGRLRKATSSHSLSISSDIGRMTSFDSSFQVYRLSSSKNNMASLFVLAATTENYVHSNAPSRGHQSSCMERVKMASIEMTVSLKIYIFKHKQWCF